jgi:hypothetical protein
VITHSKAGSAKNFKGTYSMGPFMLSGKIYSADSGLVNPPTVTVSKTGKISGTWTVGDITLVPQGTVTVNGSISKVSKNKYGQKATYKFTSSDGVVVTGSLVFMKPSSASFTGTAKDKNGATSQVAGVRTM